MKLATLLHDLFLYIPKFNFEGAYTWSGQVVPPDSDACGDQLQKN